MKYTLAKHWLDSAHNISVKIYKRQGWYPSQHADKLTSHSTSTIDSSAQKEYQTHCPPRTPPTIYPTLAPNSSALTSSRTNHRQACKYIRTSHFRGACSIPEILIIEELAFCCILLMGYYCALWYRLVYGVGLDDIYLRCDYYYYYYTLDIRYYIILIRNEIGQQLKCTTWAHSPQYQLFQAKTKSTRLRR